jgi:hypothetical protein
MNTTPFRTAPRFAALAFAALMTLGSLAGIATLAEVDDTAAAQMAASTTSSSGA